MPEPRIALGSPDGDIAPMGHVSAANARALARWWARGANGVLRIEALVDGAEQSALVLIAGGGPVGLDGMEGIRLALSGGTLSFDPLEADESGDSDAMAEALWDAARRSLGDESLDMALVVMPSATPALGSSPLEGGLAAALLALQEPTSLGDLADRIGMDLDRMATELGITTWLGLTTLKEAHTLHERRQRPVAPSVLTLPRSTFSPPTLPPRPGAPLDGAITESLDARPEGRPSPARDAPTRDGAAGDAPTRDGASRDATGPDRFGFGPRPGQATHAAGQPQGEAAGDKVAAAAAPRVPRSEPVPIARLQREAELLRHADGWTALGIPRGAAREMIVAAGARMRERYGALQRDPNPDARGYALEILRHVSDAERSLLNAEADERTDPAAAEHVAAGGVALDRHDFAKADKHFSAARRHAPNDASILAQLAWARFKNPEQKRPAREEEALELVALALQFDAECAQAWRYKAEISRAHGDVDGARSAMQTAARLAKR